ncbi:MAG: alpha/beta hydrolase [Firmicutes bacterium]|nr:alpha/beta hydrolase [Bacillota bacterium]
MKHIGRITEISSILIFMTSVIIAIFIDPLIAFIFFVCLMAVIYLTSGWLLFYLGIVRKSNRSFILSALHNKSISLNLQEDQERKSRHTLWLEEITQEDVFIESSDSLKLYARIINNKADSSRWVVICHGYANIGIEKIMYLAQTFYDMGYHVLLPDARGHGKSEGAFFGMGWPDRLDIIQWIHEINDRCKMPEIILFGVSMGAATVIMASGESLPTTVKAIVADCGYTSAIEEFSYQLKTVYHFPNFLSFPILAAASLITRLCAGYWLREASALRQIEKSRTPIFLIHGSADTFVPSSMLEKLYDAAVCPKQKMLVNGAGHGESIMVDRSHYWQAVSDFLQCV